ncbi:MAG: sialate O-acetylesterase [Defluviitaleaceae bacterium]|nr:sialate O-acetylesterase [Defluviitaleaceae bacterium]
MMKLLANIFRDGVVLQRDIPIKIWGKAEPLVSVELRFNDEIYETTATNNGTFEIIMPAKTFGGPHKISVSSGKEIEEIKDVLIGDVWICAGQSNMELPMHRVHRMFSDEIKEGLNPNIRQYHSPVTFDFHERKTELPDSDWISVKPGQTENFSATGYFFAKKLYEQHNVPIGLIMTAVGGTPVEAWMSREALADFPEALAQADECKQEGFVEGITEKEQKANEDWYEKLNKFDRGLHEKWFSEDFNDSDWKTLNLNTAWDEVTDLKASGSIWLRKTIEISEELVKKPASLILGCIIDADEVYVNGKLVGNTTYRYPPRDYKVTNLKPGENTISIRVIASHSTGGFIKDKAYKLLWEDSEILLDSDWRYKRSISCPSLDHLTFFYYKPTGTYNSMIVPLHPYAIKGVIWYQGESNTKDPHRYHEKFSSMIGDWRKNWNQGDFPFLYVGLANYSPKGGLMNWELLREEQRKALDVPNTEMIVAIDLGEHNDLHPLNKKGIGERLALAANRIAYGLDIVSSGPQIKIIERQANKLILHFDIQKSRLQLSEGSSVKELSICVDEIEISVEGVIDGETVIIETPYASIVTAISYAFIDDPTDANLYNELGLPAVPFKKSL